MQLLLLLLLLHYYIYYMYTYIYIFWTLRFVLNKAAYLDIGVATIPRASGIPATYLRPAIRAYSLTNRANTDLRLAPILLRRITDPLDLLDLPATWLFTGSVFCSIRVWKLPPLRFVIIETRPKGKSGALPSQKALDLRTLFSALVGRGVKGIGPIHDGDGSRGIRYWVNHCDC